MARSSLSLPEETAHEETDVQTERPTQDPDNNGTDAVHSSGRSGQRGTVSRRIPAAGSTDYAGAIGCRELAGRGHLVHALTRAPQRLEAIRSSLDEIAEARSTGPAELERVCNRFDVVFSSDGIIRQRDGLTYREVDDQGNRNLLDVALRAGVGRLPYVPGRNEPRLPHVDIVDAHEAFVEKLEASGMKYAVVRPTGHFSDASGFFEMACRGRISLIGPRTSRLSSIYGADLAKACIDAVESACSEVAVCGSQAMTWRAMAALSFEPLDRPARINSIPEWLAWPAVRVTHLFNRHQGEILAFFVTVAPIDGVASSTGTLTRAGTGRPSEQRLTRRRPPA